MDMKVTPDNNFYKLKQNDVKGCQKNHVGCLQCHLLFFSGFWKKFWTPSYLIAKSLLSSIKNQQQFE